MSYRQMLDIIEQDKLRPATPKQGRLIFYKMGYDIRPAKLSIGQASSFIRQIEKGIDVRDELEYLGAIKKREVNLTDWQEVYDKAHEAGMEAGNNHKPTPMVVQQHENMADDNSPVKQQWVTDNGVCGFAWIIIKPGGCSFARWLKKNGLAKKAMGGGVRVWVGEFGQSYEKKMAYATAFASVVTKKGISCFSGGRLD